MYINWSCSILLVLCTFVVTKFQTTNIFLYNIFLINNHGTFVDKVRMDKLTIFCIDAKTFKYTINVVTFHETNTKLAYSTVLSL